MSKYNLDSILETTKSICEIAPDCDSFDSILITYINSTLLNLSQLGVIQSSGYTVSSKDDEWSSLQINDEVLGAVKAYLPLKVKSSFDPPTSTNLYTAMDSTIKELEWRLNIQVD